MRKVIRFAKKKRRLSPSILIPNSEKPVGYDLKEKDLGKLHKAASVGNLSKLRQLLKKNDVNQLDQQNRAPLHIACACGYADVVTLLVENESKLNLRDNENRTPLMKAVQCEQEHCVVILLSHDADPNLVDIDGLTALHFAAMIPNKSLAMHLLDFGAHINAQDKNGFTPMLLAVAAKHHEMAEFLLEKGANVNATDKMGRTALILAASDGQVNLVKLLLHHDIDASLKEEKGQTAEDYAFMNGHHACSHLIIEYSTQKRLQSPHYGPRMLKAMANSQTHTVEENNGFGRPATDKEMEDDVSQMESFSGESKSGGDSWLSSIEDDELKSSSKRPEKLNLTKLIYSSQLNKENNRLEDFDKDYQHEEIIKNNCSPNHSPLQAMTHLLDSPQAAGHSFSFPAEHLLGLNPLKNNKECMSLEEEEPQSVKTCSRTEASEPFSCTIQVQKTPPKNNRRDLLLELGLESEAEKSAESIEDSKSVSVGSKKKSIGSFVSSEVLSQTNIMNQVEDDSTWDSENASIENVHLIGLESIPRENEIRREGDLALQLPIEELSNINSAVHKQNSAQTACAFSSLQSKGSAGSSKSKLSSYSSVQDLRIYSDYKMKNENVYEWQLSPTENEDNENGRNDECKIEKVEKHYLKEEPNLTKNDCIDELVQTEKNDRMATEEQNPEVQTEAQKTFHQEFLTDDLKQKFEEIQHNVNGAVILEASDDCSGSYSTSEFKGDILIVPSEMNEISIFEEELEGNIELKHTQKENNEIELKLGKGDNSKQLQPNLMTNIEATTTETLNKDKTSFPFEGITFGSNEENNKSHPYNQPKQANKKVKSIELKNIERLVKVQQISAMNALSAFDDSTASEMSQDEERAFKVSSSKTIMRPITISDDLNDLTESSDTASGDLEFSNSLQKNAAQLIAHLNTEAMDSVSFLKIQNTVQGHGRAVEREKKRYNLLSKKAKYLENERKGLHQTLKETREMKCKLECEIMEKDTDLNQLKFSMKQEEEKRKTAEMLHEKSCEQLQRKESQYCEEIRAKQESELIIRNLKIERETLVNNLQKPHAQYDNQEKAEKQQNCSLQDEVTALKLELHNVHERTQVELKTYLEQIETLKLKLEDAKMNLKFNEDTPSQTALQYNDQLNVIKNEVSMLTSKLELEKQNNIFLETEKEAIRSRLNATLQELEGSQLAKYEFEQNLQRERDERVHSAEKRNNDISNLHETNRNLSQRLSKEEEKVNDLDKKLHCTTLSLAEKSLVLESAQRGLKQFQDRITELEQINKVQKEQISKYEVRQIALQERLAQAHSEITLLRQQLEDAQTKDMKEKTVAEIQGMFNEMFTTLRGDNEHRTSLMEKRINELLSKNTEQREQICKSVNEKIKREAILRQLQQEVADSLKKLSMSEASLEVITRSRNEMENEKIEIQKQLEKLKIKLQESQENNRQSEIKILQLENALFDKERDLIATSQKIQEAFSASSQEKEAAKKLKEHIQRLEIENAKLEVVAKQQTNKSELMEKEFQDTESVRARLEDLIMSVQEMKVIFDDQFNHEVDVQKKNVETGLDQEMERNEHQKEVNRRRTMIKVTKKELKENLGQFMQELDFAYSEPEVTNNRLQSKIDELSNQLEVQSAKCRHLESANQVLCEQVSIMRVLQKNQDQLEKTKQQLEKEALSSKKYNRLVNRKKREEQYRKEIKEKLEEVNTFLKTHHASKETLDHLKAINELESRNDLEQKNRDLELELNKLRTLQDALNQKESAEKEIERYKGLYLEELELRKSIAAKLDRSNKRLAEANANLLKEHSRTKSLNVDSIENKSLTTTRTLNESHLKFVSGFGTSLGISRDCRNKLYPEDELPLDERVASYVMKKQDELQKSITKELAQVNADLDNACSCISPRGSPTCSLASTSQVPEPVTTATQQYLDILKKNYMI
ncbi:ankyrin repeat domain-containing protein 26 isoform X2 [Narcine bancroftii]|uniref:ankyrin repeat domain-containing protein 26 isoform X2 n=1 Tax=Narcine bancroftii TaxID=1343680 RepID=UPI003831A3B5